MLQLLTSSSEDSPSKEFSSREFSSNDFSIKRVLVRRSGLLAITLMLTLVFTACGDDGGGGDDDEDTMDAVTDMEGDAEPDMEEDGNDVDPADMEEDGDMDPGDTDDDTETCEGETRCSSVGDIETCQADGSWVTTMQCPMGCTDGTCDLPMDPGTCGQPTPLMLDTAVIGSTADGFSNYEWIQVCTNEYGFRPTGPEVVYQLDLQAPTWVDVSVTPVDPGYYGAYVRTDCPLQTEQIHTACDGNASPGDDFSFTTLLPGGANYVIVDDFEDPNNGPGQFQLEVATTTAPSCEGVIPQLLDLSSGTAVVNGDTSTGMSNSIRLESSQQCPLNAFQTSGQEKVYAIALDRTAELRASVEPTNPSDSDVAVYIRSECDERFSQVLCGEATGGTAIAQGVLEPGPYFIIVDDYASSRDEPQEFQLTVEVLD